MAAPIPPETEPPRTERPERAPLGRVVLVGVAVTLAVTALAYGLAAGPIYMLAQISPDGLDRPAFRNAFVVALVVGALLGVATGVAAAVWTRRGGHLPTDRTPFLDR